MNIKFLRRESPLEFQMLRGDDDDDATHCSRHQCLMNRRQCERRFASARGGHRQKTRVDSGVELGECLDLP